MSVRARFTQEEHIIQQIRSNLSMVHAVRSNHPTVYASSPTSTGKRMYDYFRTYRVISVPQLIKKTNRNFYLHHVMHVNIQEGIDFGLHLQTKGVEKIIVPGIFFAEGWTQDHYISLWERVINDEVDEIIFNHNWEYSDGCVQELLIGLRAGKTLRLRSDLKKKLDLSQALKKIKRAIQYVDSIGANSKNLYNTYRRIELHSDRRSARR